MGKKQRHKEKVKLAGSYGRDLSCRAESGGEIHLSQDLQGLGTEVGREGVGTRKWQDAHCSVCFLLSFGVGVGFMPPRYRTSAITRPTKPRKAPKNSNDSRTSLSSSYGLPSPTLPSPRAVEIGAALGHVRERSMTPKTAFLKSIVATRGDGIQGCSFKAHHSRETSRRVQGWEG